MRETLDRQEMVEQEHRELIRDKIIHCAKQKTEKKTRLYTDIIVISLTRKQGQEQNFRTNRSINKIMQFQLSLQQQRTIEEMKSSNKIPMHSSSGMG